MGRMSKIESLMLQVAGQKAKDIEEALHFIEKTQNDLETPEYHIHLTEADLPIAAPLIKSGDVTVWLDADDVFQISSKKELSKRLGKDPELLGEEIYDEIYKAIHSKLPDTPLPFDVQCQRLVDDVPGLKLENIPKTLDFVRKDILRIGTCGVYVGKKFTDDMFDDIKICHAERRAEINRCHTDTAEDY